MGQTLGDMQLMGANARIELEYLALAKKPPLRTADPVAAVEAGRATFEDSDVRSDGNLLPKMPNGTVRKWGGYGHPLAQAAAERGHYGAMRVTRCDPPTPYHGPSGGGTFGVVALDALDSGVTVQVAKTARGVSWSDVAPPPRPETALAGASHQLGSMRLSAAWAPESIEIKPNGPADAALAEMLTAHLKSEDIWRQTAERMSRQFYGESMTDQLLEAQKTQPKREPPTLAAFDASVTEHLLPLLPGRLRVASDAVHGRYTLEAPVFVAFVLNETGNEVYEFESFDQIDEEWAEDIARDVAWELMQRQARGK